MQFNQRILAAIMFILPTSMHAAQTPEISTQYLVVGPYGWNNAQIKRSFCLIVDVPNNIHPVALPVPYCCGYRFDQSEEYTCIKETLDRLNALNCDIVAAGISRGASALLTVLPNLDCKNIKLVIAESPYACLDDALKHNCCCCPLRLLQWYMSGYKRHGPHAIQEVTKWPADLPVVFSTVENDTWVPINSTERLFRECTSKQKYLFQFSGPGTPQHGCLRLDPEDRYVPRLHALFKLYRLPYDRAAARAGEKLMKQSDHQPREVTENTLLLNE